MEIILQQDIPGLGSKRTLVTVKNGYGRNYLIPKGFAILATPSNKKSLAEDVRQAENKETRIKQKATQIAEQIGKLDIYIPAKAGESGKIFGSITSLQVSTVLKQRGFQIDRTQISFLEDIKVLGTYIVSIELHKTVKQNITINIVKG